MRFLFLLAPLAFAGCAAFHPGADSMQAADAAMAEAVAAARAPAAEQRVALARAEQAFRQDPAPLHRLKLATLLAALAAPLRDDARAGQLLEPIADAGSPGAGRMAALLAGQVAERQRLQREVERLSREAQQAARDRERLNLERERADKERDKREEAMRQQLEALRAIERGILDREERLRRRQRQ